MNPTDKIEISSTGLHITRLGWGGAGIGGLYRESSDDEALAIIQTVLRYGLNYMDTAPMYGHGLGEERLGKALDGIPREDVIISTKVSELVVHAPDEQDQPFFRGTGTRSMVQDFSRDGTLKSVQESLERLRLEKVDILYIHDSYEQHYRQAIEETFPALYELKSNNLVKAIGVGMDDCEILTRFAREGEFDCFLLWGTYSLLNQTALNELLPLCEEKGISVILGAPYESGILASDLSRNDAKFRYYDAPPEVIDRARRIETICTRHGVPLKAAALQFVFGHPSVIATIPGTRSPERFKENFAMMSWQIPSDLWGDLKQEGLISTDAPVPQT